MEDACINPDVYKAIANNLKEKSPLVYPCLAGLGLYSLATGKLPNRL